MAVLNLAFYRFSNVPNPAVRRAELREACQAKFPSVRGTLIISEEGLNAFFAGPESEANGLLQLIETYGGWENLTAKKSWSEKVPFSRMLVKQKAEIIPLGVPSVKPLEKTGARLAPEELASWLEEGREVVLLDTRNDYEVQVGTFQGARDLKIRHFRHFPKELQKVEEELKDKPVVMFCTGGIRCEKATAYALERGWKSVYQLEGGILAYLDKMGNKHWQGECFVFDQRVALDGELKPATTLQCYACRSPLSLDEQKHSSYIEGVSCPKCDEKCDDSEVALSSAP
jgi:UPF0176 protein